MKKKNMKRRFMKKRRMYDWLESGKDGLAAQLMGRHGLAA